MPSVAGPGRVTDGRFVLRECFCPDCGTALDVEAALPDDPVLHDTIRDWPTGSP